MQIHHQLKAFHRRLEKQEVRRARFVARLPSHQSQSIRVETRPIRGKTAIPLYITISTVLQEVCMLPQPTGPVFCLPVHYAATPL
ncbi:unnamed protein product [Periconia digitata]|uniref:Uncharacterized protein n=1 Tax=Periconia digitata TaxID=1303443 RepID=A0A9W4UMA7_9PLEO|nr:unnamed protein product [Periconia digitata]